ncbi:MAG: LytR C-terminal domain-containing protein [Microbacterium sp.]|uniref:LytR C-terminal domain-containing protein n=1 Tax=Microbacterium sp. TaxID=51671 RepID=UPI0039E3986D
MPRQSYPRDRFDDLPAGSGRVGAHRAENPRMRVGVVLLWAVAATIVLVAVGIFGSLIVSGKIVLFPAATESAVAIPTVTPTIDTSYTVLVLNATSESGLATEVKNELIAQGWSEQNVNASNASGSFDTTTVYYADEDAYAAALGLAVIVGATDVEFDENYPIAGVSTTQLTVVLGSDQLGDDSASSTD